MDADIPNAETVLAQHWPLHGPYDHDRTGAAAQLLSETVRYLNYATGQGSDTALPYASTAGDVVRGFQSVAGLMDQTLRQLIERCREFAADPMLYDHSARGDHSAAVARTESAQKDLTAAMRAAHALHTALSSAHRHLNHLGHEGA